VTELLLDLQQCGGRRYEGMGDGKHSGNSDADGKADV